MSLAVRLLTTLLCVAALSGSMTTRASADPISLLGTGRLPGTTKDGLQLTPALLEDGVTPHDQVGGFGSAIAYTGVGNLYIATPDRGPADGATSYQDRYYVLSIAVDPLAESPVQVAVEEATVLTDEHDQAFTGSAAASATGLRLDPEGVRVDGRGGFFVSDEYGPYVYRFSAEGVRTETLPVPSKFGIAVPGLAADELPPTNTTGRQANRGMEGLAISPDGSKLFGMMQNALIQDGALDAENARVGLNNRILEIDTKTKATRELVYTLSGKKYGVNEIVAIDDHQLLAIERDSNLGAEAAFKRIYKIDLTGATDVSAIESLPTEGLPEGVVAVQKSEFLDLLAPAFGIAGDTFPEKVEGLAFGPRLPDGRVLLLVTSDNDFVAENDSLVWAFAIEPSELALSPQVLTVPVESRTSRWYRSRSVSVAIYGQALLPVSAIDQSSLKLSAAAASRACTESDLNGDGSSDLQCTFATRDIAESAAELTGQTLAGTPIRGARTIRVGRY